MDPRQAVVLHDALPGGQADRAAARLPSMQPVEGAWLTHDAAYAGQMEVRRALLNSYPDLVHAQQPRGLDASRAFLQMALGALPDGFDATGDQVVCPDGAVVPLDWDAPLQTVGRFLQQDVCILEKHELEHVLTGAVLCFPASWTLAQKIGRPLVRIHAPVADYDQAIASRVQRLFDGVQAGQPLWRANLLRYDDPVLFQPREEDDPRPVGTENAIYARSERQTILRLPHDGAVAFVIHTSVVKSDLGQKHPNSQTDHGN